MKHFYLGIIFFLIGNTSHAQCSIPAPTLYSSDASCEGNGSVTIFGLPAGQWLIQLSGTVNATFYGQGDSYYIPNLPGGGYSLIVIDNVSGCISPYAYFDTLSDGDWYATLGAQYVDANANGFIDLGDVVNYTLTITNPFTCEVVDVTTQSNSFGLSGTLISSIPGNFTSASYTFTRILTQANINAGQVTGTMYVTGHYAGGLLQKYFNSVVNLGITDGIRLNAFIDLNANGIREGEEPAFTDGQFEVVLNNDGVVHNFGATQSQPVIYELNPATSYDLHFSAGESYPCSDSYSCNTVYDDITVPAFSGITTYDFPVVVSECSDIGVSITSTAPRPGFGYANIITYKNYSTLSAFSGTLTYAKPSVVTITDVSPTGAISTTDGFTFNFSNLLPNEQRSIIVELQVPPIPTVALGDLLTSSVLTTIPLNDILVSNNTAQVTRSIVGAYDPNDKIESHGETIPISDFTPDDYLTYRINFENTGTADAINVHITDELEPSLDAATFRIIEASQPCSYERTGNDVEFIFSGIGLPPEEKGHVTFQVKAVPGYAVGDMIENTALIYFDFNPAIVTNTVHTTFVAQLGVTQNSMADLKVYPNPAQSEIHIESSIGIDSVQVFDISGKSIWFETSGLPSTILDISQLSDGIYFLKVASGDNNKVIKFIKA
jgi:uncharacterized repeat protein (TIGR01451 family)